MDEKTKDIDICKIAGGGETPRFAVQFGDAMIEVGSWQDLVYFASEVAEFVEFSDPGDPECAVAEGDIRFMPWITIGDAAKLAVEEYGEPKKVLDGDLIRQNARRNNYRTRKDASGRFLLHQGSFRAWLARRAAKRAQQAQR